MGFSDEWKRILRDELPHYLDARENNEPFPLDVHPRLTYELGRLSGSLTFTPQIVVDGNTYYFKTGYNTSLHLPVWDLWRVVLNPIEGQRPYLATDYASDGNSFRVKDHVSVRIAEVRADYGSD